MLGFGPLSSSSISGSPFGLIAVPLALAATTQFEFSITARPGVFSPMQAQAAFAFGITPVLSVNQVIAASASFAFGADANLRLAGKPIVLTAVPASYTLRATLADYTLKAASQPFTLRGVR